VKAGVLLLPHDRPGRLVDRARLVEACGYEHLWLADERFYREVYASLTLCALHTRRVLLGPCVTDPYSRHPALTAMAVATLDEISGGRAVLGLGAGISGFAQLGIERRRPARAMAEATQLVRQLLRGEPAELEGEVVRFHGGRLDVPAPRPGLPIYLASNGALGQDAAGRLADGAIMEGCGSAPEARALGARIDAAAAAAGRPAGDVELVARLDACVDDDGRAARDVLRPQVAKKLGGGHLRFATLAAQGLDLPPEARAGLARVRYGVGVSPFLALVPHVTDRMVDAITLAGTVAEVAERVACLGRAGIGQVIVHPFAPPGGTIDDTILRFGQEALPLARKLLGTA
jgi:5,10-methylenetetrahydromethanopterin reductase